MTFLADISGVPTAVEVAQGDMEVIDAKLVTIRAGGWAWAACPEKGTKYRIWLKCIDPTATDEESNLIIRLEGPYSLTYEDP